MNELWLGILILMLMSGPISELSSTLGIIYNMLVFMGSILFFHKKEYPQLKESTIFLGILTLLTSLAGMDLLASIIAYEGLAAFIIWRWEGGVTTAFCCLIIAFSVFNGSSSLQLFLNKGFVDVPTVLVTGIVMGLVWYKWRLNRKGLGEAACGKG